MNLLHVITEAGTNFKSYKIFENKSSREAQMCTIETVE